MVDWLRSFRRNSRTRVAVGSLLFVAAFFARSGTALAETAPLVIAWQAPDCSTLSTYCKTFIQYELPSISGIGVTMPWSAVDNCSLNALNPQAPCLPDSTCTSGLNCYKWSVVDASLDAYINYNLLSGWNWNTGCAGGRPCKIVIIVEPENDSGQSNSLTPPYVFQTSYASSLPGSPAPQDVVVCHDVQGDMSSPVTVQAHKSWTASDFALWNNTPPTGTCVLFGTSSMMDLQCASGPYTDFSGFPVVYEEPIVSAYQALLKNLAAHYNRVTGSGNGPEIVPYLAYVRAGMASGGENNPKCNVSGTITSAPWSGGLSVSAGYVIQPSGSGNPGNFMYVADGGGATGSSVAPSWCQVAGCYTSSDGTVTRWHNVGSRPTGSSANSIWPGPKGQTAESNQYSDNGYLTAWPVSSDGTGYVAAMMQFLASLSASFPWTVSSHYGPSSSGTPPEDYAYADAEALLAAQSGVGFGMQSLNIGDSQAYPVQVYPTSRQDWAANFRKYPNAPVHHLQLNAPGNTYWWAGYSIFNITVDSAGEATITCTSSGFSDCSPLSGEEIYVSGNSNISFNGIWMVNCTGAMGACPANELQFNFGVPNAATGTGGTVWSPNYWPITMPFALQIGASSLEVWECDLDYAFGHQTTTWVSTETGPGCPEWGLTAGSDLTYANTIQNTLAGQPGVTSVHADKSAHSWHF